jgi:hypothetical protein
VAAENLIAMPTVWMSFDLGVEGDYEGLYEWLAVHEARECGDSLAHFPYPFRKDLVRELTADLKRKVKLGRRNRVYLIFADGKGSVRGKFIVGGRRCPHWEGYGGSADQREDQISVEDIKRRSPQRAAGRNQAR